MDISMHNHMDNELIKLIWYLSKANKMETQIKYKCHSVKETGKRKYQC